MQVSRRTMQFLLLSSSIVVCLAALAKETSDNAELHLSEAHTHASIGAERTLRICDAFAAVSELQVINVRTQTDLGHLSYKECQDHTLRLQVGDQFQFRSLQPNAAEVGTFAISGLPAGSEHLLLVVHNRREQHAIAAFMSHAFGAQTSAAQVAVVDVFVGQSVSTSALRIKHEVLTDDLESAPLQEPLPETLPFDAVVSVSPGLYNVAVVSSNNTQPIATTELLAGRGMSYVVMRVGGSGGAEEDVVVFPRSVANAVSPWTLLCLIVIWKLLG